MYHNGQQHSELIYITYKKFSSPHSQSSTLIAHLLTSLPDSVSLLQLQRLLLISPFHEDQQSPVPRFIDEGLL